VDGGRNLLESCVQKYKIDNSFFKRYFMQNAENRFAVSQLEFMLWRRGRFIKPQEKAGELDRFTVEEIENFYQKNEINIPQLQFVVTTRCSLKCRDCNALIPEFGRKGNNHIDLTIDGFKRECDVLAGAVKNIRRFMLLGGEPLLNKCLPDIVEICAGYNNINVIEIITNGTILPSPRLLEIIKNHREKVYFHISNYSKNEDLKNVLKYDALLQILKENGIKHQMSMNLVWNREESLRLKTYTDSELKAMFEDCWLKRCVQVLNGRLSLCPRLSSGRALNSVNDDCNEHIDLTGLDAETLRKKLINFYKKDVFESCRWCVRIDEQIDPAIQQK
jgi:organic radical activating enzyme